MHFNVFHRVDKLSYTVSDT